MVKVQLVGPCLCLGRHRRVAVRDVVPFARLETQTSATCPRPPRTTSKPAKWKTVRSRHPPRRQRVPRRRRRQRRASSLPGSASRSSSGLRQLKADRLPNTDTPSRRSPSYTSSQTAYDAFSHGWPVPTLAHVFRLFFSRRHTYPPRPVSQPSGLLYNHVRRDPRLPLLPTLPHIHLKPRLPSQASAFRRTRATALP